mmetsp:Transcript_27379/g.54785  ORF Transcript_27379/g.54785 Transcript_27379/m.54785 type:complete len:271 (-) Transcript_27379:320-1132(-)|eukprot:CAMPEP_0194303196 /NCGR_PEP_ID=MMETSP0171-20130528/1124_1 /TAXON_ID=218684 /ORGANISM="Corethron pennatum, Strain L29A3" /LENGTH=270 /DNA_ID=CAMNT_0039054013 /DNA_START=124 /DNA_END=936 /DNA_ORIENTATION=+
MEDENLREPLIENASPDLEAGGVQESHSNDALDMINENNSRTEKIMIAAGGVQVVLAGVAMVTSFFVGPVVAMGLGSIVIAPALYLHEKELTDVRSLGIIQERLMREVNVLVEANKRLIGEIKKLKEVAGRLEEVEGAFKKTTELNIENVSVFAEQLEVMRENEQALEDNIESSILSHIIDAAIKFDDDGNDELSDAEAMEVIREVRDLFHVAVYENRFLEVVRKNRSIGGIMKSFRKRQETGADPEQIIFDVDPRAAGASFRASPRAIV